MHGKYSAKESRARCEEAAFPAALFCSASVVSIAHQEVFPVFVFLVCSSPLIINLALANGKISRMECFMYGS